MFNPNEHMMQLKGKDYLQVAWRLVWFREDHPDWSINADCIEQDADHAIFKAVICDENGLQKSSGHGSESKRDFGDYLEKAETKAVGRALAMLGYGTQFAADELDEGERIVDSPINSKPTSTVTAEDPKARAMRLLKQNAKLAYGDNADIALIHMMQEEGVTADTMTNTAYKSITARIADDIAKKGAA